MSKRSRGSPGEVLKKDTIVATGSKSKKVKTKLDKVEEIVCGYDFNFVEEVAEYLTCASCCLVLRDPVHLVDCGHRLCQTCYQQLKKDTTQLDGDGNLLCPQDMMKVDVDKVFEDKGTSVIIMNLKVRCSNYGFGCQWTGEFHKLEVHKKNCNVSDGGEGASKVLNQLKKRLEVFESNIAEKDKNLQTSQEHLSKRNEEVTALKNTVDKSKDRILSLEKEVQKFKESQEKVSKLEEEVEKYRKSHGKIVALEKEVEQCKQLVKKRPLPSTSDSSTEASSSSSAAKASKPSNEAAAAATAQSFQQSIIHKAFALNKEQMDKIVKQVEPLVEKVTRMEALTANQSVVFKWLVQDYDYQKLVGKEVVSPKFFTALDGHSCQLFVQWFGEKKGRLGLYFQVCRDQDNKINKTPFGMKIDIGIVDKYGNTDNEKISLADIKEHQHLFEICEGENASKGYGFPDFLRSPRLNDFIINDSLTIKCTLTP